jgi:DNA-binding beta-propeller fold protein YncE
VIRTLTIVLSIAACLPAQGELIPVPGRRDVGDQRRGVLLIGSTAGVIERFDVRRRTFLPPVDVGDSVQGMDITPDGRRLYVGEASTSATHGFVRVLDLDTLEVSTIGYQLERGEAGAWDVAIANNGKGFVTTGYDGSGRVPLRELDLAADRLRVRVDVGSGGRVDQSANVARSAARDLLLFFGSNNSSGPTYTYDAPTDTFPHRGGTGGFPYHPAVSRDGALVAVFQQQVLVYDRTLVAVTTLPFDGGHAFDPIGDRLYAVDSATDEIVVHDTGT